MRVLLVRLSAIGDVVTATPVARLLKQAWPDVHLTWAVEARCAELLTGWPVIDHLLVCPNSRQWRSWLRTGRLDRLAAALGAGWRALREPGFDLVIDLQGLFKSGLVAAATGAPQRWMASDAGERLDPLFTRQVERRRDPRHASSGEVSLLAPLGLAPRCWDDLRLQAPIDAGDRAWASRWLGRQGLTRGGFLAVAPGASRPQKQWPVGHWRAWLGTVGRRDGWPVVILGGSAERPLAAALTAGLSANLIDATGATSLRQTAALCEAARLTVSVDTGAMHLAVAAGCPTVTLFGSTPPRWFGPAAYRCLHREFACSPCGRHPLCARHECLAAIRPADLNRVVEELLRETAGRQVPPPVPANGEPSCPPSPSLS